MRLLPVAAAVALLLPLSDAYALALGRATVQSALGEPLRAEVEVTQVTPEEASSLRAAPAALEAFRAAGIERHPALADLRVSAERLGDGRFVLRLASDRVVNEPVIDLLLEATWAAGRIVRDYTLLFDPTAGQVGGPAPAAPVTAAQLPPMPAAAPAEGSAANPAAPASGDPVPIAAAPPAALATPSASAPSAPRITVRPGDTAGRLAAAAKPDTVSLEQMLVALLRANPDAFVGNNMNRLRAGAVLEMPPGEAAAAIEAREARRTVIAQSQDFNAFRRRLAERAAAQAAGPQAAPGAPSAARQSTGQVEAQVEEKRPAAPAPDRLTLSKGAVQGASGPQARAPAATGEDRIARQRAEQDANNRQSELERNIAELNKLSAAAGTAAPPAAPGAQPASAADPALALPGSTASAPNAALAAASSPEGVASAAPPASAAAASVSASAPVAAPATAPSASSARASASSWGQRLSVLAEAPWPLAIGSAVVAGLAAIACLLWWSRRSRRPATSADDSRLGDDGDAGDTEDLADDGSGGVPVERPAGRSSLLYSPSQLDTSGEPDPVAEAEVYLAYGRDLQAEEILQEALRASPDRLAVITKLLEVQARRFDWDAFEPLARRAQALTGGRGPEWERIVELGRGLAPVGHPLFGGGSAPAAGAAAVAAVAPAAAPSPSAYQPLERPAWANVAPGEPSAAASEPAERPPAPASTGPTSGAGVPQGLDLDLAGFRMPPPSLEDARATQGTQGATRAADDFEFDPEIDGQPGGNPPAQAARAAAPAGAPLEFDLAGLSLDLGGAGDGIAGGEAADPLATKLSLAEEFRSIGDHEGARSLAEEVRAEASGELRQRAERLLAELD